jgi:hydrogenase expression/formation protein HypD
VKYVEEYRSRALTANLVRMIRETAKRRWVLMEVCGGQTHSIVRYGLDRMLPDNVELVHGPGCPVCVTALETIDRAHAIAKLPDVIFTSFGDMLRVPGSSGDLLSLKARGAEVRVVYSPLDAIRMAQAHPDARVVFFGIGFETTAPANAMAIHRARALGLRNFSVLASHVLVPPAIASILQSKDNRIDGFLGPGHVCAVMGTREYESIALRYETPIVITGFEPVDLLEGVLMAVRQLEAGRSIVENPYVRTVTRDGNVAARAMLREVFETVDRKWRGIGFIPKSGYKIRHEFADWDAERLFDVEAISTKESSICVSGQVLRGLKKPCDCSAFGKECTPKTPLGATMVSAEGACAAYYASGRHRQGAPR